MIYQRPHGCHARDRQLAAMPTRPMYPLSAARSEPLWSSIAAGIAVVVAVVCLIVLWSAM